MTINIYPILSSLHNQRVFDEIDELLAPFKEKGINFNYITDASKFYDGADLSLILVQSGGSENLFLKAFGQLKEPYYLLTYGANNSLAASLEIMAFLIKHGLKGEVLHGDNEYLLERFNALAKKRDDKKAKYRLGVIGHPSDWLISSDVDYQRVKELFDIELVDLPIAEVADLYQGMSDPLPDTYKDGKFNEAELTKAYHLYQALEKMVEKNNLNGFTIRCFDLLGSLKTTACLALAIFNSKNDAIGTCEGDIPSMLSMFFAKYVLKVPSFQANPSRINVSKDEIVLAHCTLPLSMCESYVFDTHFESGIGVGIHGEIKEGPVTIFRINSSLTELFVEEGEIEKDLYEKHLCRTQIVVKLPHLEKILRHPLGNHEIVIKGHKAQEVKAYFEKLGFKTI